jgi:hypothetical protein
VISRDSEIDHVWNLADKIGACMLCGKNRYLPASDLMDFAILSNFRSRGCHPVRFGGFSTIVGSALAIIFSRASKSAGLVSPA